MSMFCFCYHCYYYCCRSCNRRGHVELKLSVKEKLHCDIFTGRKYTQMCCLLCIPFLLLTTRSVWTRFNISSSSSSYCPWHTIQLFLRALWGVCVRKINVRDKLKIKRRAHKIQTFICLFLLGKAQSEDSLTVKEEERDGRPWKEDGNSNPGAYSRWGSDLLVRWNLVLIERKMLLLEGADKAMGRGNGGGLQRNIMRDGKRAGMRRWSAEFLQWVIGALL